MLILEHASKLKIIFTLHIADIISDLPSENIHSNASNVKGSASAICRLFTYAEKFINIRANKRAKADNVNE